MSKTGVLLINLGTPNDAKWGAVRTYLSEFLNDPRVIDLPWLFRKILVNGIIIPFRSFSSTKIYKQLWTEKGSPLIYHGESVAEKLQSQLGEDFGVHLAMRYQNPSIEFALDNLKAKNVGKIIVLPLFPQYASASTGSVIQKVNEVVNTWQAIPEISFINQFFDHPKFIKAFVENGLELYNKNEYDFVVFSYHGLPERQIEKASVEGYCQLNGTCCSTHHSKNKLCYRAQCYATTRLLAEGMGLKEDQYTTTFQSRLGKTPWIKPYTDEVLKELPAKGIKKVLAFSPAFIADCLETTVEVGETFKEEFLKAGGERWDLVPSLNNNSTWVECLEELVKK